MDSEGQLPPDLPFPHFERWDFISFFPALAARSARQIMDEAIASPGNGSSLEELAIRRSLSDEIQRLADDNPYQWQFPPDPYPPVWRRLLATKNKYLRLQTEILYLTNLDRGAELWDEVEFPRTDERLKWAEQRLTDVLGFQKKIDNKVTSFEDRYRHGPYRVLGDPRNAGKLVFHIYGFHWANGRED